MDPYLRQEKRRASAGFLSWLLVLAPSLLALLLWLSLQRAIEILLVVGDVSTWSWSAIKSFAFIAFGLAWLASVFFMQHLLYRSALRGRLSDRILQLLALLLGLLACSQAIRYPLGGEEATVRSVLPVALEAALAVLLYAGGRTFRARRAARSDPAEHQPR